MVVEVEAGEEWDNREETPGMFQGEWECSVLDLVGGLMGVHICQNS